MSALWSVSGPPEAVRVAKLTEFGSPWEAIQWACHVGGPGHYAVEDEETDQHYLFEVHKDRTLTMGSADFEAIIEATAAVAVG